MIKLLSTEDTLPVIAEKCKYAWTPSKLLLYEKLGVLSHW
jgi:hypothetical protein